MAVVAASLFYDTNHGWLDSVRAWAAVVPEVERVWVFGSRATGQRGGRRRPDELPDLDLAYTLTGGEPGELLALSMFEGPEWRRQLQEAIPVPVDLQLATPEDRIVWPSVKAHGVLVYVRP